MEKTDWLETYVEDYFDRMERLAPEELDRRQDGLFASLAFGAAGIAYSHWHAGVVRGEDRLLRGAERWIAAALARRRRPRAFFVPSHPHPHRARGAFLHGLAGVYFTSALVAHARGAGAAREAALWRLGACCRSAEGHELCTGQAGALVALALVHPFGDPRLAGLGHGIAAALARHLERGDAPEAGPRGVDRGLAHGTAGVLYALLCWTAAAGADPSPAVPEGVGRLLDRALDDPASFCPRPAFLSSLCNGFAGLTLLAAKAAEVLGGSPFRDAALRTGRVALQAVPSRPDLCCGRIGIAFACLVVARLDPDGPWRTRASELALSALLCDGEDWEVSGLYGGEAALPCLAVNLSAGIDGGPPCLELPAPARRPEP